MAETVHIAEMAEKLSDELFSEFFWTKVGPTNQSWPCEDPESHNVSNHPTDVVFYYDEPYSQVRTYVNCDLKSYKKNSINSTSIRYAIESLAKQISCAEKSENWQNLYTHNHVNKSICGLLFIYNHDGEYDKEFKQLMYSIRPEFMDIPKGTKIVVFGPEDILWLDNIRYEIRQMRGGCGQDSLPGKEYCQFFYPQLVRKANVQLEKAKSATLEMLTSPWIVLEYKKPDDANRRGVVVFYRRPGTGSQEFEYLIDYLRHYQVLREDTDVHVKIFNDSKGAKSFFQRAVQNYNEIILNGNNELSNLVNKIKFSSISQVKTTFSTIEIGMDYV